MTTSSNAPASTEAEKPHETDFKIQPAMRGRLLVIGAAVLDRIFYVDSLPKAGETAVGDRMEIFPGGKGANQALAAALMGADVRFISAVGTDEEADVVLEPLVQKGVDVDAVVHVQGEHTGETVISVDARGENQIVACPNAYHKITVEHLSERKDSFEWAEWLLIQNELPRPVVDRALDMAMSAGLKIIFNTSPFKPKTPPPPRNLDLLVANEVEAAGLLGVADYFSLTPQKRLPFWKQLGAQDVLITLGRHGGEWFDGDGKRHEFKPHPVKDVVDTVGAGDAFCGILGALMGEGFSLEDATRIAHVGAGLSVTRKGAQTGLPTREELVEVMQSVQHG